MIDLIHITDRTESFFFFPSLLFIYVYGFSSLRSCRSGCVIIDEAVPGRRVWDFSNGNRCNFFPTLVIVVCWISGIRWQCVCARGSIDIRNWVGRRDVAAQGMRALHKVAIEKKEKKNAFNNFMMHHLGPWTFVLFPMCRVNIECGRCQSQWMSTFSPLMLNGAVSFSNDRSMWHKSICVCVCCVPCTCERAWSFAG